MRVFTYDIVSILIPDQCRDWTLTLVVEHSQRSDNCFPLLGRAELDTLLHYVAGKLVF